MRLFRRKKKRVVVFICHRPTVLAYDSVTERYAIDTYVRNNGMEVVDTFRTTEGEEFNIDSCLETCHRFCVNNDIDTLLVYSLLSFGHTVETAERRFRRFCGYTWNIHFINEGFTTRLKDGSLNPVVGVVDGMFGFFNAVREQKLYESETQKNNLTRIAKKMKYKRYRDYIREK